MTAVLIHHAYSGTNILSHSSTTYEHLMLNHFGGSQPLIMTSRHSSWTCIYCINRMVSKVCLLNASHAHVTTPNEFPCEPPLLICDGEIRVASIKFTGFSVSILHSFH